MIVFHHSFHCFIMIICIVYSDKKMTNSVHPHYRISAACHLSIKMILPSCPPPPHFWALISIFPWLMIHVQYDCLFISQAISRNCWMCKGHKLSLISVIAAVTPSLHQPLPPPVIGCSSAFAREGCHYSRCRGPHSIKMNSGDGGDCSSCLQCWVQPNKKFQSVSGLVMVCVCVCARARTWREGLNIWS